MHARTPEGFFSYVDHMAPCGHNATPDTVDGARYADLAGNIVFERKGAVDKPKSASVRGAARSHRSAKSRFGPGDHPLQFEIAFSPRRLFAGLNSGRTEVFGHSRASLTIDGRERVIEGPAQFHEQRQSTPRFTRAFAYLTLWAEDAASTLLIASARRDGYILEGERSTSILDVRLGPPGQARPLRVTLEDGRVLDGVGQLVQAYTIPVVGKTWSGHMVSVDLGGRGYHGHMNDFLADRALYIT